MATEYIPGLRRLRDLPAAVAELLALRRWATGILARAPDLPPLPEGLSDDRWRVFLRLERCAGPLLEALREQDRARALDGAAERLLRGAAQRDTERALRAERDGRRLGEVAGALGIEAVVLKGGAPVIAGAAPAPYLADLDLLLRPRDASVLRPALRRAGYVETAVGADEAECHHESDRLPLDLHWGSHVNGWPVTTGALERAVALPGAPGLARLGAGDQLEHLLLHAVTHHVSHLPRLRDLLLIGATAAACTAEELADARAAFAGHRHAAALEAWLGFAQATEARGPLPADPAVASAVGYLAAEALATVPGDPDHVRNPAPIWRFAAVESGRSSLGEVLAGGGEQPTAVAGFAGLQRRSPRIGGALVNAVRATYYLAATAAGGVVTVLTRRALRPSG